MSVVWVMICVATYWVLDRWIGVSGWKYTAVVALVAAANLTGFLEGRSST